MRRSRLAALVVVLGFLAPALANAQGITQPVTGTVANGGTFNGVLNISQFNYARGVISAVGTLSGTLTDAAGNVVGNVTNVAVSLPVTGAPATGSCTILTLDLGPLDLNLLGLMVHLNEVVLNITAQSGSGNLLGNLLCAVAHLLDSNASGNAISNLLNQILSLL